MASRGLRIVAWIAGGLAALVVLLAVFFAFIFDWNWLQGPIERRATAALGRQVAIDGNLHVDLGRIVKVRVEGLRVANTPWARDPEMARVEAFELAVRFWPLLAGRIELPDIKLIRPKLVLEKSPAGEPNWKFKEQPKDAGPEKRAEFPIIEQLVIEDGQLAFRDPTKDIDIDSRIHTAVGGDPAHERVHLAGEGSFKGEPAHLEVQAGSLLTLRETKEPYPLLMEAAIGQTRARAEGTIDEPVKMAGVNLALSLSGPDMGAIFPIFGIPMPATRDYAISGRLLREGNNWTFRDAKGKVGESDLSGALTVVVGGKRPLLRANLVSDRLALADLAGFIGGQPGKPDETKGGRVLPDRPVNLEKLHAIDADVRFKGNRVEAPGLPMDGLDAHLALNDGLARLDPLAFAIAQGSFAGTVVLDARAKVPQATVNMAVSRMSLQRFFANTRFADETSGTLSGRVELKGQGRSTADLLAGANGRVTLMMSGGSLSALVVEAMGLDLTEALGFALGKDKSFPVRCMVTDFAVQNGLASSRALVLDTTDTVVTGGGTIDLGDERMDLKLEAHPKDPSPLSARSPVNIGGNLGKPKVSVDAKSEAARGGLAVALGALLTPLAAILPFLEPGLGEDQNCGQLLQQAQAR